MFFRTSLILHWPAGMFILLKTNICLGLMSIANTLQKKNSTGTEN